MRQKNNKKNIEFQFRTNSGLDLSWRHGPLHLSLSFLFFSLSQMIIGEILSHTPNQLPSSLKTNKNKKKEGEERNHTSTTEHTAFSHDQLHQHSRETDRTIQPSSSTKKAILHTAGANPVKMLYSLPVYRPSVATATRPTK